MNRYLVLDGRQMNNLTQAHTYLAKCLHFPQYYGHNLDALYDILTSKASLYLIICYADQMDEKIWDVFNQVALENAHFIIKRKFL